MNLRKNILNIEKMVRYGQGKQVRDFYKADPAEVVREQRESVRELEWSLDPYLSSGNAKVLPFIDELYYIYVALKNCYIRIAWMGACLCRHLFSLEEVS